MIKLNIQDTFNKELPSDPIDENTRRQVFDAAFSFVKPRRANKPELLHVSAEVAEMIGLSIEDINSEEFVNIFSGNQILPDTQPYAMCYGGHQFGNWAGQLGDGRAINMAEIIHDNKRWALQLKGSGETPYSRSADGLAVLRSSIREHLCSEAMYHLNVPTTRSLSLMLSGDQVMRDVLYNGNSAYEPGAIVCRVAPSFLRFGNYQLPVARRDVKTLKTLVDYTIKYFYPELYPITEGAYLAFFKLVTERTLDMIIEWKRVGFVHGVMNTDNMSILGLTIDYGPYGWLEGYDHDWTPNTTDSSHRRYRFGKQHEIGLWNLFQLANALFPLIEDVKPLETILNSYKSDYDKLYLSMMKSKLGLYENNKFDSELIKQLAEVLQLEETDMTIFFRLVSNFSKETLIDEFGEFLEVINDAFYDVESIRGKVLTSWINWFEMYQLRLKEESLSDIERKIKMDRINPKYIFRNYMAQLAIDAAEKKDYSLIDEMYKLLKKPYDEQTDHQKWFAKRPEWARNKVGCSMLSCSS